VNIFELADQVPELMLQGVGVGFGGVMHVWSLTVGVFVEAEFVEDEFVEDEFVNVVPRTEQTPVTPQVEQAL